MFRSTVVAACLLSFAAGCLLMLVVDSLSDTAASSLADVQGSLSDANKLAGDLRSELAKVTAERDEALKAISQATDAESLESARARVTELEDRLAGRNVIMDKLEDDLREANHKIRELTTQLANAKPSGGSESDGFSFTSVSFRSDGTAIGEVTNRSGTDYETALFDISIYDGSEMIDTAPFSVNNLPDGATRPFRAYLERPASPRHQYKIDFDAGF